MVGLDGLTGLSSLDDSGILGFSSHKAVTEL